MENIKEMVKEDIKKHLDNWKKYCFTLECTVTTGPLMEKYKVSALFVDMLLKELCNEYGLQCTHHWLAEEIKFYITN